MQRKRQKIALKGDITVAYRRDGKEWYATALEFDIMGYGSTRPRALAMLRELLETYFREIARLLSEGKEVKFFNPSDQEEWNRAQTLEEFDVAFIFLSAVPHVDKRLEPKHLGKLAEFIESLDDLDVELVPA